MSENQLKLQKYFNKCPCLNCIILPICKNRYIQAKLKYTFSVTNYKNFNFVLSHPSGLLDLVNNCCLLVSYINEANRDIIFSLPFYISDRIFKKK